MALYSDRLLWQPLLLKKAVMHGGTWQWRTYYLAIIVRKHLNMKRGLIQWMSGLTQVCSSMG